MDIPQVQASTAARYIHSLCQLLAQAGDPVDHLLDGTGLSTEALQSRVGMFIMMPLTGSC